MDLGWIKSFWCRACGREVLQRPELWTGVCHTCSPDCLLRTAS